MTTYWYGLAYLFNGKSIPYGLSNAQIWLIYKRLQES